jgi:hypothetical protein
MSIDVICHTNINVAETNDIIDLLENKFPDIFEQKYLIFQAKSSGEVDKEITSEYNFNAISTFVVRYNDKTALDLEPLVLNIIKSYFGEDNILILFENETRK